MYVPRNTSFGELHFGKVELGDARRTKRLIKSANIIARHPGGSLPEKFKSPKDLKGFYRLCNCPDVTHEALIAAHREMTLERLSKHQGPVIIIHDATELDYSTHKSVDGFGQIGNGNKRGYIAHNSLAIDANSKEAIGLSNQILHRRANVRKNETEAQRRKRKSRESRLWVQGVEALPGDWNLIDVCDQGADTFEFLFRQCRSGRRFVIRSAYSRGILIGHDEGEKAQHGYLRDYAKTLPELGRWELKVTSKEELKSPKKKGKKQQVKRIKREATMAVAAAPVQIKPPGKKSGEYEQTSQAVWIVRVWEVNPPKGQERLEWFLLTNEPVNSFEAAYRVVGWYETRWVVEVYQPDCTSSARLYRVAA